MNPALLVIDIQHWFFQIPSFLTTEGLEKVDKLVENTNELTKFFKDNLKLIKTRTNSFLHTELDNLLKGLEIDTVVVSGYSTNKCVGITSIEACERDYQVILSEEATLGPQKDRVEAMKLILKTYGIEPENNKNIIEIIKTDCEFKEVGGSV